MLTLRHPCVAGQFYPAEPQTLRGDIARYLTPPTDVDAPTGLRPQVVMLPHAGYVYCGGVIGATLTPLRLPDKLLLLGPNHTGKGQPLAVWAQGEWLTPLGAVSVDAELAAALLASDAAFSADDTAHMREHSIEVLLPFLQMCAPQCSIVPVCVGTGDLQVLERTGHALGRVLRDCAAKGEEVGIIVSSDMNHFADHERTLELDNMALAPLLRLDPYGLAQVVSTARISMCGVCPMLMALFAGDGLGISEARLVQHTTSAAASGDTQRVVGYAGVYIL